VKITRDIQKTNAFLFVLEKRRLIMTEQVESRDVIVSNYTY